MDKREKQILQILNNGGYTELTIFQRSIIPLALQRKNIIAETGENAGKTVSYIIPSILSIRKSEPGLKVLVISSSVEGVIGIHEQFQPFIEKEKREISLVSFTKEKNIKGEHAILETNPDILLSTPDKIIDHIRLGNFENEKIDICIIDCENNPYEGFSNDIEFILSELSKKTRYWAFIKDREMVPLFHKFFINPSIIYSEQGVKKLTPANKREQKKNKMAINEEQEKAYAELIKKIIKTIKEDEDPNELNEFRKIVRKNVPFTLRGYFSAYLLKNLVTTKNSAGAQNANKPDKNYRTLFINIGRTRGLNPQSLIRYIVSTAGIDGGEIGQLKVHDNYSFADITEENAQTVIDSLNSKVYRGRTLAVNFAKKNENKQ